MNADEKRKWVMDKLKASERLTNTGIAHFRFAPYEGEYGPMLDVSDVFPVEEQKNVLKLLEADSYIKINWVGDKEWEVEMLPAKPSPIKLRALELIARALGDKFTGSEIVDILVDYGIPRSDINYPNTKWRTLQEAFLMLATSPNPEERQKFWGVIPTFLHPLNFSYDESVSTKLAEDFNKYLKYDGYEIAAADDGDGYKMAQTGLTAKSGPVPTTTAPKRVQPVDEPKPALPQKTEQKTRTVEQVLNDLSNDIQQDYSEQIEYETKILRSGDGAETATTLRKAYTTLMNIAEVFSADPSKPDRQLNNNYVQLSTVVEDILAKFTGDTSEFELLAFDDFKKIKYGIPFANLYSAEHDFKKKDHVLSWDSIRPEMNLVLGRIENVCEAANAGDVIADPKMQKLIGDTMLLLSKIIAERQKKSGATPDPVFKVELTKVPEFKIPNNEDAPIIKGKKRIHLPKFVPTDWAKITVRFLDERNVIIDANKKQHIPADYESLGFADDKRGKPNSAWRFFYGLALNNGETKPLPSPIPDTVKQHKKLLSDRLKTIFQNDTDPFNNPTSTRVYRIKLNLIPPQTAEKSDALGVHEFLDDAMVSKYEQERYEDE